MEKSEEGKFISPDYSEEEEKEVEYDKDTSEIGEEENLDDEDIYGGPSEDDEEDEKEVEKIVEKQDTFNNKTQEENKITMGSTSPFSQPLWGGSQQSWGSPGTQQQQRVTYPWEKDKPVTPSYQQTWQPYGFNNNVQPQNNSGQPIIQVPKESVRIERPKQAVIIDVFDGLIESYSSEGKPNIPPRGLYDIKFKLNVWDSIATFSPRYICAMYPIIAGWNRSWDIAMRYLIISLAEYLKIPEDKCILARQASSGQTKSDALENAYRLVPFGRKNVVYIGVYSGYWGLGNGDLVAAKKCGGIEYADIFQLLKGEV